MKKILVTLLIGFILGIVVYIVILNKQRAQAIEENRKLETEVRELDLKNERLLGNNETLQKEKAQIRKDFETQPVRTILKKVEEIKTIFVDKIEYVPKIEYVRAYEFSLEIQTRFRDYIDLDKSMEENFIELINNTKAIIVKKDLQIKNWKKLYRKARRRISLVIGGGIDHRGNWGVQITFGYRIF